MHLFLEQAPTRILPPQLTLLCASCIQKISLICANDMKHHITGPFLFAYSCHSTRSEFKKKSHQYSMIIFCLCLGTVGVRAPCYLQCYTKECFDRCKKPHPSGTYHTIDLACHLECDPTCMNEKCPGGDYPTGRFWDYALNIIKL